MSRRQDVKARTMKFAVLDPDIASKYEDLDDDDNALRYNRNRDPRQRTGRGLQLLPRKMIGMIESHINKKNQSMMRTAGGGSGRRDLINIVTVKNASRSGKEHVLKLLADYIDQFLPISPKIDNNGDLSFFICNDDDAQAVCAMSKRIADKNNPNMKLVIYKRKIPAPFEPLNYTTRQIIEQILHSRYNKFTNSLDLSSFQNDSLFEKNRETPRGLFHNNVMVTIANCVAINYSGVRGIRLNNNSLRTLDYISTLVYAAPNVVELDLANNAMSRVEELNKLSGWLLESVHFENNEFTLNYRDNFVGYTNAIHEHFPHVSYLDGVRVNVALKASVKSPSSLPIPRFKVGYYANEEIRNMAEKFLLEYFKYYDGIDGEQTRQQLINAYDSNATFSYAICTIPDTSFVERGDQDIYRQYMRNSHNVIHQQKWQSFRDRLVFRGPMDIAVALSKLPPTEHINQSFLLDFNMVSQSLMVITLQGIFRDGKNNIGKESRSGTFKFFVRQLTIIPKSEGLAILSDMLQITPVGTQRMERYNNLLKGAVVQITQRQIDGMAPPPPSPQAHEMAQSSSSMIKQELPNTSVYIGNYDSNDPLVRDKMVEHFCLFSGMRADWSRKCLQDCSWNWEDAQVAFGKIRNQIPAEAFTS